MQRSQPPYRYWAPSINMSCLTVVQWNGKTHRVPSRKWGTTVVSTPYEEAWVDNFKDAEGTPEKRLMWRKLNQQMRAARAEKERYKAEEDEARLEFEKNIKDGTWKVDLEPDMNITDPKLREEDFKLRCEMENFGVAGAFSVDTAATEDEAGDEEAEDTQEITEGLAAL